MIVYGLMCGEHNCGREYRRIFESQFVLEDAAREDGWRVEGDEASCPACFEALYWNYEMKIKPQQFACRHCGCGVFGAYIIGRYSYWNVRPAHRGHEINHGSSTPGRITMDKFYHRKDNLADPDNEAVLYTSHRCRMRDIRTNSNSPSKGKRHAPNQPNQTASIQTPVAAGITSTAASSTTSSYLLWSKPSTTSGWPQNTSWSTVP